VLVQADGVGPIKAHPDRGRVGARRDLEIIFDLAAGAVINQIDAGVNSFAVQPRVSRHARVFSGDEIVRDGREPIPAFKRSLPVGTRKFQRDAAVGDS
jgi:hypothetical protein